MKYFFNVIAFFFLAISLNYGKIKVCTTTSLIENLVQEIGGDLVEIKNLMGPGVDPHLYKAASSDIEKLRDADIIFYNGLHLEGRMTDMLEGLAQQGKAVFPVTAGIDKTCLLHVGTHTDYDPHVWFDPALWSQCARKVLAELQKHDPKNASQYQKQADIFLFALEKLLSWAKEEANKLPAASKILITSHDAYNYFGRAFQFQVIGVQGISTVSEAGLADIISTIDFIKKHKVKAIFVESSVSPVAINRISQDAGVKIGGKLFSDSLGKKEDMDGFDVSNYLGMFEYNVTTIIQNLK